MSDPERKPSLEEAMAWLDENCSPERLAELLAGLHLDEDELVRAVARAAADGDPEARRWVLERQPEAADRLLDEANKLRGDDA